MKSEFAIAFNQICAEYNLPRDVVLEAVNAALATAYRRNGKTPPTQNITAEINMETGLARLYAEKTVVETVSDEQLEIALPDAKRISQDAEVGSLIMVDVTPHNFGRIAAQTAKQVITQRLREAERENQFTRFSRQENEIVIGTVQSITPQGITLHLERTEEAHMPRYEQIPNEHYRLHQKIRVYVLNVRRTGHGPQIIVSRSHQAMLRRLLELEVPEIHEGQVEIKGIAREAGTRSKLAVASRQEGLDPVGACVGMRGIRIQTISRELNGERIDVVEWSNNPAEFIANALSLKTVLSVILDERNPNGKTAAVVVQDDQLSLAIGRSGQNARLAAKLTGWRVDIQGITEAALEALDRVNKTPELLVNRKDIAPLIPTLVTIMRAHESGYYPYNDEELTTIKAVVEGVQQAVLEQRDKTRSISPQMQARQAAQIQAQAEHLAAQEEARARVPHKAYETPLELLGLSTKVLGHLHRNGLNNVGEVMERMALGDEPLLMLKGIGGKSLDEIKAAVEKSVFAFIEPGAETPVAEVEPEVLEAEVTTETEEIPETPVEAAAAETPDEVEAASVVAVPEVPAAEKPTEAAPAGIPFYEESKTPEDEEDMYGKRKRGKKSKRRKTLVYDEESGETFVIRKRRRSQDMWDEYLN
ncbi:MAG: hypothetical protein DRI37_02705 [Chloroflexi bacterium]|nr:MAG: hypothetical protein DRI37_02705 [Chloroflexota bacterium]